MSDQVVKCGDKLHVITRRLFADDFRRHFAGEVTAADGSFCQLQGYTFVHNSSTNEFRRRPELRTRIFSFADAIHIVNKLPSQVEISSLEYRFVEKRLVVMDKTGFYLDINEFGLTS